MSWGDDSDSSLMGRPGDSLNESSSDAQNYFADWDHHLFLRFDRICDEVPVSKMRFRCFLVQSNLPLFRSKAFSLSEALPDRLGE